MVVKMMVKVVIGLKIFYFENILILMKKKMTL